MVRRCAECFYNMGNCGDNTIICDVLTDLLKDRTDSFDKENQKIYRFLVDELNLVGDVFYDEARGKICIDQDGYCKNWHPKHS